MKGIKGILALFFVLFQMSLFSSPLEIFSGRFKLVLYPDSGSFSLQYLSDTGKNRYESLFDDRNNSANTFFSVLCDGRVFKLSRKAGRPLVAEVTESGARFVFSPSDDFEVKQYFSFVTDASGLGQDFLRIETILENISGKPRAYALKALFDTNLGEGEGIHFTTNVRNRISSELSIDFNRDKDSILISSGKNRNLVIPFLFQGVTKPDQLIIANWTRLNTLAWLPSVVEGRTFNTVYSVNDSAVLLVWPTRILESGQTMKVNMILSASIPALLQTAGGTSPDSAASAEEYRLRLIDQIIQRISEMERNTDAIDPEEIKNLNEILDQLLSNQGVR